MAEDDLLERLGALAAVVPDWSEFEEYDMACICEAAAEIERLRAALEVQRTQTTEAVTKGMEILAENTDLRASLSRAEEERETLREGLKRAAASVTLIAFEIPPPNAWTPQLVSLAQSIERHATGIAGTDTEETKKWRASRKFSKRY